MNQMPCIFKEERHLLAGADDISAGPRKMGKMLIFTPDRRNSMSLSLKLMEFGNFKIQIWYFKF